MAPVVTRKRKRVIPPDGERMQSGAIRTPRDACFVVDGLRIYHGGEYGVRTLDDPYLDTTTPEQVDAMNAKIEGMLATPLVRLCMACVKAGTQMLPQDCRTKHVPCDAHRQQTGAHLGGIRTAKLLNDLCCCIQYPDGTVVKCSRCGGLDG